MKLYLSNKLNLNSKSTVDNLYKNKNYDRTKKKEKKRKKKRLMLIIMADKASLFFRRKIKDATYVF